MFFSLVLVVVRKSRCVLNKNKTFPVILSWLFCVGQDQVSGGFQEAGLSAHL